MALPEERYLENSQRFDLPFPHFLPYPTEIKLQQTLFPFYNTIIANNTPMAAYANPISSENRPAPDVVVAAGAAPVVEAGSFDVLLTRNPADSQNWTTVDAASVFVYNNQVLGKKITMQ